MNFDNKIKNDFWARDRTRALWVKAEHVSQSAMGQTMPAQWEGVTLPNFVVTGQKLGTNFVFGTRKPVFFHWFR